ncbi:DUF1932 domain-containing protein [Nocardia amamiensis]|uniref:DUF1932 domain-containing protein n=1 Tax=Nocardia amamiensis TaxID=404578 RepID=UPI0012F506E9
MSGWCRCPAGPLSIAQTRGARLGSPALAERDALSGVAARAWRWVPEIEEVGFTLEASGLPISFSAESLPLYGLLPPAKDVRAIAPEQSFSDFG